MVDGGGWWWMVVDGGWAVVAVVGTLFCFTGFSVMETSISESLSLSMHP